MSNEIILLLIYNIKTNNRQRSQTGKQLYSSCKQNSILMPIPEIGT